MSFKVLLPQDMDIAGKNLLKENNIEIVMGKGNDEKNVINDIKDCDAVITRNAIIGKSVIDAAKNLKVIAKHGVGVDMIDVDYATEKHIAVVNAGDSNKLSVAEYTIGLILSLAKNYVIYDKELRKGNWDIRKVKGMDVEGKTLGLIGYGKIAKLVAKKAHFGLDMNVKVYRRNLKEDYEENEISFYKDIKDVIKESDFLSLHIPYTKETKQMIGKEELSLMKESAFLINTARGEVVDNKYLYEALKNKKIAGAAIDVFDNEMPDSSDPLFQLENVIVTPHCAAFSMEGMERMSYQSAQGIIEVLLNKKVTYPVNNI